MMTKQRVDNLEAAVKELIQALYLAAHNPETGTASPVVSGEFNIHLQNAASRMDITLP
jgi:hypothetical protein